MNNRTGSSVASAADTSRRAGPIAGVIAGFGCSWRKIGIQDDGHFLDILMDARLVCPFGKGGLTKPVIIGLEFAVLIDRSSFC